MSAALFLPPDPRASEVIGSQPKIAQKNTRRVRRAHHWMWIGAHGAPYGINGLHGIYWAQLRRRKPQSREAAAILDGSALDLGS